MEDELFAAGVRDPSADEGLLVGLFLTGLVEAPEGFGLADAALGGPVLTTSLPGLLGGLVLGLLFEVFGGVLERVPFTFGFVFTPDGDADLLFTPPDFCSPVLILEFAELFLCVEAGPFVCGVVLCLVTEFCEVVDNLEGDSER